MRVEVNPPIVIDLDRIEIEAITGDRGRVRSNRNEPIYLLRLRDRLSFRMLMRLVKQDRLWPFLWRIHSARNTHSCQGDSAGLGRQILPR